MMRSSAQRDRCTRCSAAKKSACARAQPRPPRLRPGPPGAGQYPLRRPVETGTRLCTGGADRVALRTHRLNCHTIREQAESDTPQRTPQTTTQSYAI